MRRVEIITNVKNMNYTSKLSFLIGSTAQLNDSKMMVNFSNIVTSTIPKFPGKIDFNKAIDMNHKDDIKKIQSQLQSLGYAPNLSVNGMLNIPTFKAVNKYKSINGIPNAGKNHGVVDLVTWNRLFAKQGKLKEQYYEWMPTGIHYVAAKNERQIDPSTLWGTEFLTYQLNSLNKKVQPVLRWNQDKINKVWQASEEIYEKYGIKIDPRFLLAIILSEGTGSFNTSFHLAKDGGHGASMNFDLDLNNACDLVLKKMLGYHYYNSSFNKAVRTNKAEENKSKKVIGISDDGDVFQYVGWNNPIFDFNCDDKEKVKIGEYAGDAKWGYTVAWNYNHIINNSVMDNNNLAIDYSNYIINFNNTLFLKLTKGMKLPSYTFGDCFYDDQYIISVTGTKK